jgi:LysM repeat protein
LVLPVRAQSSETGGDSDDNSAMPNAPRAQPAGPDAAQDAEAAREKLLKAADQIDMMESNSEANKAAMDDLKTQLTKLQDDNTALKLQVSTLQDTVQKQQDALDHMQAEHAKERQALIDEVSALVAGKPSAHRVHHPESDSTPAPDSDDIAPAPVKKKEPAESLAPPPDTATSGPTNPAESAGADDSSPSTESTASATPAETPRPHKGWIYVVKPHETLTLIVGAFRDQGVKVTVSEVRKANGLTSKSVLKVGQKLFIPKPGT